MPTQVVHTSSGAMRPMEFIPLNDLAIKPKEMIAPKPHHQPSFSIMPTTTLSQLSDADKLSEKDPPHHRSVSLDELATAEIEIPVISEEKKQTIEKKKRPTKAKAVSKQAIDQNNGDVLSNENILPLDSDKKIVMAKLKKATDTLRLRKKDQDQLASRRSHLSALTSAMTPSTSPGPTATSISVNSSEKRQPQPTDADYIPPPPEEPISSSPPPPPPPPPSLEDETAAVAIQITKATSKSKKKKGTKSEKKSDGSRQLDGKVASGVASSSLNSFG